MISLKAIAVDHELVPQAPSFASGMGLAPKNLRAGAPDTSNVALAPVRNQPL